MSSKIYLLAALLFLLCLPVNSIDSVDSFEGLAQLHCKESPVELIYRLATGQLAEIYGAGFKDLDCYVRQFVNKDGQDKFEEVEEDEEDEENQEQEEYQEQQIIPENDPIVIQYAKGISGCLPEGTEPVEAVYAIWRFYRFVVQHDYALEWMRAKIRASLGYEAEKPSSWMDGEQSSPRLRLDKLFSNQFYEYVDQLMFRDFLHPFMTFLKKNVVFAANGALTHSGKPILVQFIESKNILDRVFIPIVYRDAKAGNIFTYTLPGVPLFLGGTTSQISWAFTGVLVDRSNIEQIETLGTKFFHHGSETWIKLQNVTQSIKIKDQEPAECKFVHSAYGTLYEKHESEKGKIAEYIARWHEKQRKVRVIFSDLYELIQNNGRTNTELEFPFSSLVLTNNTGIYQYICFQKHPSYFLYPDLTGAPEPNKVKWASQPKRNFLVVSNTHLTTMSQESYLKRQIQNPTEEQFMLDIRRKISSIGKFDPESLTEFVHGIDTDPLIKKRKDLLIQIYRKAKFLFFPDEKMRKQCDQLIALLEKWDHHLNSKSISPVFILWDYFFREYTFNYASSDEIGRSIAKHKIVTDTYWTNQMDLWKVGTSYGECDSAEWEADYKKKLNNTGQNSTCFFNIMRGINRTRQILRNEEGGIKEPQLADWTDRKIIDLTKGYLGTHTEEAFSQFFSKNVAFTSEIGSSKVTYWQGYKEVEHKIDLSQVFSDSPKQVQSAKDEEPLDTDL